MSECVRVCVCPAVVWLKEGGVLEVRQCVRSLVGHPSVCVWSLSAPCRIEG